MIRALDRLQIVLIGLLTFAIGDLLIGQFFPHVPSSAAVFGGAIAATICAYNLATEDKP